MPKVVYTPVKGLVQEAGTNVGGAMIGFVHDAESETLSAVGPVSISTYVSFISGTRLGCTLADGTVVGQLKKIMQITEPGAGAEKSTVIISSPTVPASARLNFTNLGDTVELMWNGSAWRILSMHNTVSGLIDTPTATV